MQVLLECVSLWQVDIYNKVAFILFILRVDNIMKSASRFSQAVSCLLVLLLAVSTAAMTKAVAGSVSGNQPISVPVSKVLYSFGTTTLANEAYMTIDASGVQGYTTVLGEARLPMLRYFLEIPLGATPSVTMTQTVWTDSSLAAVGSATEVVPVQPSVVKLPDASAPFTYNAVYYSQDSFQPASLASVSVVGEVRGHTAVLLEVSPVQYNPTTGALRLLSSCVLQVTLSGGDMGLTKETIQRYDSNSFAMLEQTMFSNYGTLEAGTHLRSGEGYLIIVDDTLYDTIQPFATWKGQLGFDVTVTKTSEIPGGVTKEKIKTYIKNAYENWSNPPVFLLLVGDTGQIPTWTGQITGTCTDLYYVTLTAGDYFADIFVGRFPAATVAQLNAMVDKTLYYETGNFPNETWIKKAAFLASNDNYQISEGTHNYVIDTYLTPANYTCDKLYSHEGATTQQVKDVLNDGRSLCIYSGHGSETSWADGPPFSESDVNSLTNDGIYPFVCSHACLTCQFTVSECFGETWLRGDHKGGLAFWGASDYSYWDEDDILERSMFKAWWVDNVDFVCGMTNAGLHYLYEHYGGGGNSQYYFEEYNLLGDPSVKILRGSPNPDLPPDQPNTPSGSTHGVTFVSYTYTVTVPAEPEGQQVYMQWDFGNGNRSDIQGPFTSGAQAQVSYVWRDPGVYNLRVQAQDVNGSKSKWSDPLAVTINLKPRLNVTAVKGGLGVRVTVKNTVNQTVNHIAWTINFKAPMILISLNTGGVISFIDGGQEATVKCGALIGFGALTIDITAGDATATATGFLLGPFVLGVTL